MSRQTKKKLRTFENFPEDSLCPVCGTNDDGETVLVPIIGTSEDGICQAKCLHLVCAVVPFWHDGVGGGVAQLDQY